MKNSNRRISKKCFEMKCNGLPSRCMRNLPIFPILIPPIMFIDSLQIWKSKRITSGTSQSFTLALAIVRILWRFMVKITSWSTFSRPRDLYTRERSHFRGIGCPGLSFLPEQVDFHSFPRLLELCRSVMLSIWRWLQSNNRNCLLQEENERDWKD